MSPLSRSYLIVLMFVSAVAVGIRALAQADAQIALLQSPSSDAEVSRLTDLISARGLAGGALPDPRAIAHSPTPRPGASVSEAIITLANSGEQISKAKIWSEPLGSGSLELQETTAMDGQTTAEYWVFASDHRRCVLNGDATYGKDGRLLSSNFWRNDPQLSFLSAHPLPNDVFPSHLPPSAVLVTLNSMASGSTGELNMVLGRYGYMTFDLWAEKIEQIAVPAGTFRALKVMMRVNADSVMKYWPTFLKRLAQPFFPQNVLYYDVAPPHHLVKFVGSFGYLAPKVTVQMTTTYVAAEPERR